MATFQYGDYGGAWIAIYYSFFSKAKKKCWHPLFFPEANSWYPSTLVPPNTFTNWIRDHQIACISLAQKKGWVMGFLDTYTVSQLVIVFSSPLKRLLKILLKPAEKWSRESCSFICYSKFLIVKKNDGVVDWFYTSLLPRDFCEYRSRHEQPCVAIDLILLCPPDRWTIDMNKNKK